MSENSDDDIRAVVVTPCGHRSHLINRAGTDDDTGVCQADLFHALPHRDVYGNAWYENDSTRGGRGSQP